jgi:hypothetical protein
MAFQFKFGLGVVVSLALGWTLVCLGQTSAAQQTPLAGQKNSDSERRSEEPPASGKPVPSSVSELPGPQIPGMIHGTVIDQSEALVAGARVKLTGVGQSQALNQEVVSDNDGQFSFAGIAPGSFQITITSAGFGAKTVSVVLHPGENLLVPQIALEVAEAVTDVEVGLSQVEVAEEQMKIEEKQRVLGAIPNFYVSYIPDAAPMSSKQKFKLALRTVIDPFTFVVVGGGAGVEQAQNHFAGYGQGAQGYGKRFGAAFADTVAGTFIGAAVLPSLLKQDPRYFYKGTGSVPFRFSYAIANALICKGDNGRWQVNYSNIFGNLAAGGISNLYYPAQDRDGAGLTLENGAIGIASTAIANLFQEFLIRKLTRKAKDSAKP